VHIEEAGSKARLCTELPSRHDASPLSPTQRVSKSSFDHTLIAACSFSVSMGDWEAWGGLSSVSEQDSERSGQTSSIYAINILEGTQSWRVPSMIG